MDELTQDIIIVNHNDNGTSTPSDTYTESSFTSDIPRLQPESVELGENIGQGGSAYIYKGTLLHSTLVAVKQFKQPFPNSDNSVRNEMKILTRLRNSNFMLHIFGYIYDGCTVAIVMEYAENGDLLSYLLSGRLLGDWPTKAKICIDIAKALESLHNERVVHLDVKPVNILLDGSLTPKLSDFGISKTFTSIANAKIINGPSWGYTLTYISPERVRFDGKKFTHEELIRSDIYAYGILVREIATDGKQLYKDEDVDSVLIAKIQKWDQLYYNNNLPDDTPPTFRDTGYRCLEYDPLHRPPLSFVQKEFMAYTQSLHSRSREELVTTPPNQHMDVARPIESKRAEGGLGGLRRKNRRVTGLRKRNRRVIQIGKVNGAKHQRRPILITVTPGAIFAFFFFLSRS